MSDYIIEGVVEGDRQILPNSKWLWKVQLDVGMKDDSGATQYLLCSSMFKPSESWIGHTAITLKLANMFGPEGEEFLNSGGIENLDLVLVPSRIRTRKDLLKLVQFGYGLWVPFTYNWQVRQ